jgi:hypothetical protein
VGGALGIGEAEAPAVSEGVGDVEAEALGERVAEARGAALGVGDVDLRLPLPVPLAKGVDECVRPNLAKGVDECVQRT